MENNKSFKQKCEELDIDYTRAINYKYKHKGLTDEQVIKYFTDTRIVVFGKVYKNVQELANDYKLKRNTILTRRRKTHESYEDIIKYYTDNILREDKKIVLKNRRIKNGQYIEINGETYSCNRAIKEFSLKEGKIRELIEGGMTRAEAVMYTYNNNLTANSIEKVEYNGKIYNSITELLKSLDLSRARYRRYAERYPEKSLQEIIDDMLDAVFIIDDKKYNTFKEACEASGLNYLYVHSYAKNHNLKLKDAIEIYKCAKRDNVFILNKEFKTIKEACEHYKVSYDSVINYRNKNKDKSLDEVFEFVLNKKDSFTKLCVKYDVNYYNAMYHKRTHTELTDEQVIMYFRPDLYINIFGELVSINGD